MTNTHHLRIISCLSRYIYIYIYIYIYKYIYMYVQSSTEVRSIFAGNKYLYKMEIISGSVNHSSIKPLSMFLFTFYSKQSFYEMISILYKYLFPKKMERTFVYDCTYVIAFIS